MVSNTNPPKAAIPQAKILPVSRPMIASIVLWNCMGMSNWHASNNPRMRNRISSCFQNFFQKGKMNSIMVLKSDMDVDLSLRPASCQYVLCLLLQYLYHSFVDCSSRRRILSNQTIMFACSWNFERAATAPRIGFCTARQRSFLQVKSK